MNSFLSFIVIIAIFKRLSANEIFETVEAVAGQSVELPCNVTAEKENDKLNILAWYKNGSSTAFYSRDLRSNAEGSPVSPKGRYRLVSTEGEGIDKLLILSVQPYDSGLYHCFVDFASSPAHKTFVQLVVIEPPQRLWVIHENGTRVATASIGSNNSRNIGPFYVGETVHLVCVAFGGKPQPSLSWRAEQRLLKETSTPLSEHRVHSDLVYGPLRREDHGLVFTCFATNNKKSPPISIDIVIEMHLSPELVSVRAMGEGTEGGGTHVSAGATLLLQCRVLGARPLPPVMWRLGDAQLHNLQQNVTKEPSQRLVVSEVELTIDREYDESQLTCCTPAYSRSYEHYVCAQGLPLTVSYKPELQIVIEGELDNSTLAIVKGSNVSMNCNYQANPSIYQLSWYHEDDIITRDKDSEDVTNLQSTLELKEVTEEDAGEYVCSASNEEGHAYSDPVVIDVTYPPYCEDENIAEYGLAENECVNITCNVKGNPEPTSYRWIVVKEAVNASVLNERSYTAIQYEEPTLIYQRRNGTPFSTIFCWGLNDVTSKELPHTPCTFLVTEETVPRPPINCAAVKNSLQDITVTCDKGHDGGLPQKFTFIVKSLDSEEQLVSITNVEPKFIIQEPSEKNYKFIIVASNEKGDSTIVEIEKDKIIDESTDGVVSVSAVTNITTLSLALFGGVALLALAACGLVLCAHERNERLDLPRVPSASDPPLCAYNTEESNCETYHDSDDGSECNVRRTDSFRRAVSRYPSKNYDVRRAGSFHSARYMNDVLEPEGISKCNEGLRHNANCRVHSLQNINRKREMDALCDHLVMHLPPEPNYNYPRPVSTFYTMPRKMRQKLAKELSDETSEVTQASDGFSLPPPPDEFGTYRAGTKIRDMPSKSTPTYTTIVRNSSGKEPAKQQYNNVIISPMNTVGLPTISGAHSSIYSYPDDEHQGHQVNTNPFEDSS